MRRDDNGSVTAFVAVIATALVLVAGMVIDGGGVVSAGVDARRVAFSAARAGAQEIDIDHLRATGQPALVPDRAERSAREFLEAAGADGTVAVSGATVTVTVVVEHHMRLLPLPARQVAATRTARATPGITSPGDLP